MPQEQLGQSSNQRDELEASLSAAREQLRQAQTDAAAERQALCLTLAEYSASQRHLERKVLELKDELHEERDHSDINEVGCPSLSISILHIAAGDTC